MCTHCLLINKCSNVLAREIHTVGVEGSAKSNYQLRLLAVKVCGGFARAGQTSRLIVALQPILIDIRYAVRPIYNLLIACNQFTIEYDLMYQRHRSVVVLVVGNNYTRVRTEWATLNTSSEVVGSFRASFSNCMLNLVEPSTRKYCWIQSCFAAVVSAVDVV